MCTKTDKPSSQCSRSIVQALELLGAENTNAYINANQIFSIQLAPTERLINAGDQRYNLYYFSNGLLKIVYCLNNGREFIRAFIVNGMFFVPISSYLQHSGASCYVEAIEFSEAEYIPYSVIESGLEISLSLNKALRRYMNQHFIRHERRELALLSSTAAQRYMSFLEDYPELDARLPRNLVASYLGITEQSLSRVRKSLGT